MHKDWPDWPIIALQICGDTGGDCVKVELDDVVRSAQKPDGAKNHIRLEVQKKDGTEYGVFLLVPEKFLGKVLFAINIGMSLREIGLLEI